ncbi:MAG: protease pro-enzyme activation domain-containing protein [Limisphaerales bacterium]
MWILAVVFLTCALMGSAQTPPWTVLPGHVPKVARGLQPLGRLDGTNRLKLSINLPLRNRDGLTSFLQQLYDPASPAYRHYLSPEEFDARFGPTEEDYQAVLAWAARSGFTIAARHDSRMLLEVNAQVSDIERALQMTLHTYAHPTEARTFYAPDTEPSVDARLPILNIDGLNTFARPHPKNLRRTPLQTPAKATPKTIGSGPQGNLAGYDYRAAYAPGVTLTGAGQSVGLVEFDGYYPGDITSYENQTSVPDVPLQKVLVGGFSGKPSTGPDSGNSEVALDIEMTISMAPGLSNVVVFEAGPNGAANTVLETMSSAAHAGIKQFSCSWDFGPLTTSQRTTMDNYFMKFASDGQSFFDAVGDFGGYTNGVAIPPPDDDPYVTLVGGTALGTVGPGGAWSSETVWNTQEGPGGYMSSGGSSPTYGLPPWQQGVSMSANNGSTTQRNIPDVAMVADNVFIEADNGQQETSGGTSCGSPLWAGFTALANEQAVASGLPVVGFLNPALYHIGTNSAYAACFDDITAGNNTNVDVTQWVAVPGYDLCTGWGSPSGGSLIIALTQPDGFQITPARGAVANGALGGPFTVPTQTFTLANAGQAAFNWAVGGAPNWLTVSSTGGALTPGGEAVPVSVSLNSAANVMAPGVYTANLWFTNLTSGLGQLRQFALRVGQELVLDGGFEAGDFAYWNLSGDSSIYTNNFVDSADDIYGLDYPSYPDPGNSYLAALGELSGLAYLSQPLPTQAGQFYLLSLWLANTAPAEIPNQFVVQWNSSNSTNTLFNQSNLGVFDYTNLQYVVKASASTTTLQFGNINQGFFCLDDVSVVPVPIPTMQALVLNGALQLSWTSLAGLSYQVQSATDLSLANWVNLGAAVTASGNDTSVQEVLASGGAIFYRVVILP